MMRLRATLTGAKRRFVSKANVERAAMSAALVAAAPRKKSRRLIDEPIADADYADLLISAMWVILFVMTAFPEWLVPMAATLTQERFSGPEWIFERKFDGIRLLAYKKGSDV